MKPAATKAEAAPAAGERAGFNTTAPKRKPGRPVGLLLLLGILFVTSLAYHLRVTMYREQRWFGIDSPIRPFFVDQPGLASRGQHNAMSFVVGNAFHAGLRDGDALLAVNGRAVTGTAVFGEELRKSRPGELMTVSVLHHEIGQPPIQKTVSFLLQRVPEWNWQVSLRSALLLVVLPFGCMLLGFWVAFVRPRDPLAWLVLALMLSFTCFGDPNVECWPPYVRDLGMIFRMANRFAFAIWLLLFGLYFPEPLPAGRERARWVWLKWVMMVPLILLVVMGVVTAVGELENFAAVGFLERLPHAFTIASVNFVYIVFAMPIYLIGRKYTLAPSADAKRRLRLLIAGSLVTLVPWWLMRAFEVIKGVNPELYFPFWLWFGIDVLFFFFPIVLAYVIVVQRAMDVRFVVRQGLQYALAKNGVRVIQIMVALAAFFAAATLIANSSSNRVEKIGIVIVGLALVPLAQRGAERLRHWVDRRFFREAYNAEQVLSDLSDQVRTMIEPQSLLETVVTRIADTLHVSRMAALLDKGSPFRPVYALGFESLEGLEIPSTAATVRTLQHNKEPLRVYLDDDSSWIHHIPGTTAEERLDLERLHAELLLPLAGREKLLGIISLGPKKSEEPFTGSDLRLLKSVANQTGLALENAQLLAAITEEVAQRERLNREVEIAREVQERLFPQELPPIAGLDYWGACRPALGVGGDYYDFLALPGGRLGIAIGDVSGKGIGAALLMASLEASLRAEAARGPDDLAALVGNVNRLVYQASTSNRYATFFYAQYDAAERRLIYVNAGHNPPILFRKHAGDWEIIRLTAGGTVVGLLDSFPYQQETLDLQQGDMLVAFTDGISEAMNPGDEEWGEEGLIETVQACSGQPSKDLVSSIIIAADGFASGAKQHDDMTLVVLRVLDGQVS
jgi:sigma-B regulation protein RsbU (phosphoserine phosphatase)